MDYGVRIMMALGVRAGERVSGAALAKATDVSRAFVLKIVRQLAEAGLVEAQRGVGGGITLARDAQGITLFDILQATDGRRGINPCLLEPGECSRSGTCAAHRVLRPVQEMLDRELTAATLADLVKEQLSMTREREGGRESKSKSKSRSKSENQSRKGDDMTPRRRSRTRNPRRRRDGVG